MQYTPSTMELVEAILMNGNVDLCTALHLRQSCQAWRGLVSEPMLSYVVQRNDDHFLVWLTKHTRMLELVSFDDVKALRDDMKFDKTNIANIVDVLFRSTKMHDISKHPYIIKSCFWFDIQGKDDAEMKQLCVKVTHMIACMLDTINGIDDTIEAKAMRTVFLFEVLEPILLSTIRCNMRNKSLFPFCKLRFLNIMEDKLRYFLVAIPPEITSQAMLDHVTTTLNRIMRMVRAWTYAIVTNKQVQFGKRGGMYIVDGNGRKRYW